MVTNGFINPEPLEDLLEFTDAFNIDLKAFDDEFYKKYSGRRLKPVLVIKLRDWIAEEVGIETPVHLSSYYPTYKMSLPPTPYETVFRAREILKEKFVNVY